MLQQPAQLAGVLGIDHFSGPSRANLRRYAAVLFVADRILAVVRTTSRHRFSISPCPLMSRDRSASAKRVVSRDPDVMSGELVFAGTRVPVQTLIDYLKAGQTLDRFLEGFPTVEREQAEAYLEMTLKDAETHA
jgi:uncharacterized protein (DUF433 family)